MHEFFGEVIEVPLSERQAVFMTQVLSDAVAAARGIQVGSVTADLSQLTTTELYLLLNLAVQRLAGVVPELPEGDPVMWRQRVDRTRPPATTRVDPT